MLADVIRIPERTADLYVMDLVSDLERARSNLEIASRKLQVYPLPPEKRQEIQTHIDRMITWTERTADNLQGVIV